MHIPTTVLLSYITIISLTPIVSAHGKVAVVKGDAGGNGTALGILGGIVPGTGDNSVTEVDATVFKKRKLAENGLGKTKSAGANKPESLNLTMAQSGGTLPQVSPEGGRIRGVWHIVTTDGAGPIQAVIDSTATGTFSQGEGAKVVTSNLPLAPFHAPNVTDILSRRPRRKRHYCTRWLGSQTLTLTLVCCSQISPH